MLSPDASRSTLLSLVLVSAAAFSGCTVTGTFVCEADEACVLAGVQGTCEPAGYCSFPDDACGSGKRYGSLAPTGIGDRCVPSQGELDDAGSNDADAATVPVIDAAPGPIDASAPDAPPPPPDAAPPDAAVPFPDAGGDDQIVTLAAAADAWIDSENPIHNHGSDPALRADGEPLRHALLRFDLTGIPDGAIVQAAQLELHTTASGGLPAGGVQLFRVLQGWHEGAQNGTDGAVNWIDRSPTAGWTTLGAGPPTSRDTTVVGELTPSANNTLYLVPLSTALVQAWAVAPASNNGVILVTAPSAGGNSVYFVAREGAAAKRPRLRIVYRLP